jgi:hypothetical protein
LNEKNGVANGHSGLIEAVIDQLSFQHIVDSYLMHQFDWSTHLPNGCPLDAMALAIYKELLQIGSRDVRWVLSYRLLDINPLSHWWWNSQITDGETMRYLCGVVVCHTIRQQLRLHISHVVNDRTPVQKLAADVLRLARTTLLESIKGVNNDYKSPESALCCFVPQATKTPHRSDVRQRFHGQSSTNNNADEPDCGASVLGC